ncbi:MAG TPA: Mut7-C RNAse domain-containing protein [Thermodesulfobacteriota bacterium]|nr:Mut7-C RNAse domain-containing protein [Thermodesulfobacteriota bacterium]
MKFLADVMLGKLARELRMLGYDTLYYRGQDPHELIQIARQQERLILTRNIRLTPKTKEDHVVQITEDDPVLQLKGLRRLGIITLNEETLFSRCLLCNSLLNEITREEAEGRVPDFIFNQQKEFYRCSQCSHIYWPGSHQERMQKRLKEFFQT